VIVHHRHPWDLSYREAGLLQERLREDLVLSGDARDARLVAGADVSCEKWGDTFFAGVVVMDAETFEIVDRAHYTARVSFPYVPGFLSFREGPVMLAAFERLGTVPDAVIFDGQGIAHPRGLGLAAHMGLLLGIPTVGSAKTRLVGEHGDVGQERGSIAPLVHDGRGVGYVVRTRRGTKPVFVSPGNLISPEAAVDLVLACTVRYRVPEPVRQAHLLVNRLRKESYQDR
jgi:deoxyribonuclease V